MRASYPSLIVAGLTLFFALPALAGTVTVTGGVTEWQSTGCVEPPESPALLKAARETPAEDMNILLSQYNTYAQLMQDYMNCLSTEAQNDAARTSEAIVQSARGQIDDVHDRLEKLGVALSKD